jgi:putative Mg2+ transporter-C (MgtC) family protein
VDWVHNGTALLEILLASILGGVVGLEREVANKPAGLRTHMLVAASAALLIALGGVLVDLYDDLEFLRTDPIRIIEAIIVGISFLGAGTIFQREQDDRVEGLTTSASILFTAGIGISVGLWQIPLAVGSTILILTINYALRFVEVWIKTKSMPKD